MSEGSIEKAQDIIEAADLVKDLTETTERVLTRRNMKISGPLDLKYRTIHTAVDMQGCHFLGDVDLGYCNFEQAVDFTGCTFHQAFNTPDQLTSPQFFRCQKDFTCNKAVFEGQANFGGVHIERALDCVEACFKEPVSFNGIRTEGNIAFNKTKFAQKVDFIGLRTEGQLNCTEVTFNGRVDFNLMKCEGAAFFNGATFEKDVDFSNAPFGSSLDFSPDKEQGATTFKGAANFGSVKCEGDGFFNGATFEKDVDFSNASFGSSLDFSPDEEQGATTFKGAANFNLVKCEGDGFFNGATFEGPVSLYALKCGGDGWFSETQFQSTQESNFSFSHFDGSLSFFSSSFSGPLKLEAVEVARELDLTAQQFRELSLYNTTTDVLALAYDYEAEDGRFTFPYPQATEDVQGSTFKRLLKRLRDSVLKEDARVRDLFLQSAATLDLRGFTFKRLRGSEEEALKFAMMQKLPVFSLDPYVQLEEHYEKVGKDTEARDVHYHGRCAMRRNAASSSDVRWTFERKVSDSFLRALTGYGVRTSRVAWASVVLLVVGVIVFSLGDFTPLGEALSIKSSETSVASGAPQKSAASEPTVVDQISYSLDRFIPVSMGIEDSLEPRQHWSRAYALIHAVAGWLLIPLFLASWSGLVRSGRR